jgi:hypothetical protein
MAKVTVKKQAQRPIKKALNISKNVKKSLANSSKFKK